MKQLNLLCLKGLDLLDSLLDHITTYRLVLYLLYVYLAAAVTFSFSDRVPFSALQILASAGGLVLVCRVVNRLLAGWLNVPRNHESDIITALILALILTPANLGSGADFAVLAASGAIAVASKYLLVIRKRHIFNPAALGAYMSGELFNSHASWWIGNSAMAPLLIIGGLLILRKMRHFSTAGLFIFIYVAYLLINSSHISGHLLWLEIFGTPLLFLVSVMLTEPLTSPTALRASLIYSAVVAVLYSVTKLHFSPEEALLVGNVLTFAMMPNRSQIYSFVGQKKEAEGIYSYLFHAPKRQSFQAGQYIEWTLPGVETDSRGNRRYLTIASSPTEDNVMVTVKIPDKPSRFKLQLQKLKKGDQILASQLAGDFLLPRSEPVKLAFIAGGIGVTPFRSMIKYAVDKALPRDVKLLYSVNSPGEIAYKDLLDEADQKIGLKTDYIVSQNPPAGWKGLQGFIDEAMLKKTIPDYKQRYFYVSGPQGFVAAVRQALLKLDVPHHQIKTDFFPGYN